MNVYAHFAIALKASYSLLMRVLWTEQKEKYVWQNLP